MVDAVSWELSGASRGENEVALQTSEDDLCDDELVGDTDDEAVLGSVAIALQLARLKEYENQ